MNYELIICCMKPANIIIEVSITIWQLFQIWGKSSPVESTCSPSAGAFLIASFWRSLSSTACLMPISGLPMHCRYLNICIRFFRKMIYHFNDVEVSETHVSIMVHLAIQGWCRFRSAFRFSFLNFFISAPVNEWWGVHVWVWSTKYN